MLGQTTGKPTWQEKALEDRLALAMQERLYGNGCTTLRHRHEDELVKQSHLANFLEFAHESLGQKATVAVSNERNLVGL